MISRSPRNGFVTIEAGSINEVLYDCCKAVMEYGTLESTRGLSFKELHPATIILDNPTKRHLLFPYRMNNPFAQMAETLWVLAGRNDIGWLTRYLPRALQFSDDAQENPNKVWRAGYGPRLRKYGSGIDQIRFVYDTLKKDMSTRQAVINIWDAEKEDRIFYNGGSKDYPCNDLLQFIIRNGRLDLTVYVRSNDIIWGLTGVNIIEFSVLQEIIALMLGVPIGKYYIHIGSLHIYDWHFNRARAIYACDQEETNKGCEEFDMYSTKSPRVQPFLPNNSSIEFLDKMIVAFFVLERKMRDREYKSDIEIISYLREYSDLVNGGPRDLLPYVPRIDDYQIVQFVTAITIFNMYLNKEHPRRIEHVIHSSVLQSSLTDPLTDIDFIVANWLCRKYITYSPGTAVEDTFGFTGIKLPFMRTECTNPHCIGTLRTCPFFHGGEK